MAQQDWEKRLVEKINEITRAEEARDQVVFENIGAAFEAGYVSFDWYSFRNKHTNELLKRKRDNE